METNKDKVKEFIDSKMGPPPSPPPMMTQVDSSEDTEDSLLLQLLEAYSQSDLANPLNAESTIDLLQ
jgi:hypothetical protein